MRLIGSVGASGWKTTNVLKGSVRSGASDSDVSAAKIDSNWAKLHHAQYSKQGPDDANGMVRLNGPAICDVELGRRFTYSQVIISH